MRHTSNVPSARLKLQRIALHLRSISHGTSLSLHAVADQIMDICASDLRRGHSDIEVARVRHSPMTDLQKAQCRTLKLTHPDMHLQDIAELVGTNAGRVSEAIAEFE